MAVPPLPLGCGRMVYLFMLDRCAWPWQRPVVWHSGIGTGRVGCHSEKIKRDVMRNPPRSQEDVAALNRIKDGGDINCCNFRECDAVPARGNSEAVRVRSRHPHRGGQMTNEPQPRWGLDRGGK